MTVESVFRSTKKWLKHTADAVKWNLKSRRQQQAAKRQKLECELTLNLLPFVTASAAGPATVFFNSRCMLERLPDISFSGDTRGLSNEARALAEAALGKLIVKYERTTIFPMSFLHGCNGGKSENCESRARLASMAEFGKTIYPDLSGLEGLEGEAIIEECKQWHEFGLEVGIRLYTDTWHKRFYWMMNGGGSHHMAKLCFELQEQQLEWAPQVNIVEYALDLDALDVLRDSVSIFVITHNNETGQPTRIFNTLHYQHDDRELPHQLGVTVVRAPVMVGRPACYDLVVVDHSREYSDHVLKLLKAATFSGHALSLTDFLNSWVAQSLDLDTLRLSTG